MQIIVIRSLLLLLKSRVNKYPRLKQNFFQPLRIIPQSEIPSVQIEEVDAEIAETASRPRSAPPQPSQPEPVIVTNRFASFMAQLPRVSDLPALPARRERERKEESKNKTPTPSS